MTPSNPPPVSDVATASAPPAGGASDCAPGLYQNVDADIAVAWPEAWERANDISKPGASKRRNKIRSLWKKYKELQSFIAANSSASCLVCKHSERYPHGSQQELYCQLDSDFYGYAIVEPGNVCARWVRKMLAVQS